MNRAAQTLVLTAVGGVALRVSWSDEHLRYVNEWMRWPLFASGLLLLGLAITGVVGRAREEESITSAAWLLLLPVLVAFVVQPPALGSYVADRRVNDVAAAGYDDPVVAALPEGEVTPLGVSEFVARAASYGDSITDREVALTGFVSTDDEGRWYVTRLAMACCAADAAAFRVLVEDAAAPAEDEWVEVTGTWVEGSGSDDVAGSGAPPLQASDVVVVDAPRQTYE